MANLDRFAFVADYFDAQAGLTRQYQVLFYASDSSVEMYDMKTRRVFLKRCPLPSVNPAKLLLGDTITVFSRQLRVVDYGDEVTRQHKAKNSERGLIVVGDKSGFANIGTIARRCSEDGLRVGSIYLVRYDAATAASLHVPEQCYLLEVIGSDLNSRVTTLQSRFPDAVATLTASDSIEFVLGQATRYLVEPQYTEGIAVLVIKPHSVASGDAGRILQRIIDDGFDVVALTSHQLRTADSEDFLEVYKGVLPEYKKIVEELSSGPCWAVAVRAENAVESLRVSCGPHDPEVCKALFPLSLRGEFGIDRTKNAVHCTDLHEDAALEYEFFFKLLRQTR